MLPRRLLMTTAGGGAFVVEPTLYALYNGGAGVGFGIGAATKLPSGVWVPYASNPVIGPGVGGSWDDAAHGRPCLLWDGSEFRCYYDGYDGSSFRIGLATAPAHTGPWTKHGSNPILGLGSGGAFDDSHVSFPTVLYEPDDTGREWKMWYAGGPSATWGTGDTIGYAYSSDGISWTKHGQVLGLGSSGQWDDEGLSTGAIIKIGSTYYLFYAGAGDVTDEWQGGFATFTDAEGTYTKFAGNPTQHNVNTIDPDASQPITADLGIGDTVVHLAETSFYSVGQPVHLQDGNSETEAHRIASIDSGTQLTLAEPTVSAFTDAQGCRFRPNDYLSVGVRTVRPAFGGGYELYSSTFQWLVGASASGATIREGSLRYTAAAIDDDWLRDDDTGQMFPMYPTNAAGWDRFDAENPSVIAAP